MDIAVHAHGDRGVDRLENAPQPLPPAWFTALLRAARAEFSLELDILRPSPDRYGLRGHPCPVGRHPAHPPDLQKDERYRRLAAGSLSRLGHLCRLPQLRHVADELGPVKTLRANSMCELNFSQQEAKSSG